MNPIEIWGGIECTVNRHGDRFADQCGRNGHFNRPGDLDAFASLGLRKLRYPVLWEHVAPASLERLEWGKADAGLTRLRELGVDPIVGLLHHGSGPVYTSLIDPEFPEKLAAYAGRVAERFPWVKWYTPVNEPLTTARFSCLYGIWYPHLRDDASFARALYNQIKGTVLAMRAIRCANPEAKLVQTDDLGRILSTPRLAYQANFENERRFLSFELLLGRVDPAHFMYDYLTTFGKLTPAELDWLVDHPCPPDIVGLNHYPLSNRFLDHRLELYPETFHGGNGRHRYADVGAVDTGQTVPPEPVEIFRDAWERLHLPIAITEVHISGGREAQLRWLREIWSAANRLRSEGCDIRAVTAWSLLGSYDWNTLCTVPNGHYEPGIFDVRTGNSEPRPTALATFIKGLAEGTSPDHAVLDRAGYWREAERRVLFAPSPALVAPDAAIGSGRRPRPVLITGGTGTLGRAFATICTQRGLDFKLVTRAEMDIADPRSVRAVMEQVRPWAVVNAAGFGRVDDAENQRELCHRENAIGAQTLADICVENKVRFVTFSSDQVFGGGETKPYDERGSIGPLNFYGQTKAEAERRVLHSYDQALVVRTSAFFGPGDANFFSTVARTLRSGQTVSAAHDVTISPTYLPDLVHATLDLLIDGESGIVHLTNEGTITWHDWARWIARKLSVARERVVGLSLGELGYTARRPVYSALASERFRIMPGLEDALERCFHTTKL